MMMRLPPTIFQLSNGGGANLTSNISDHNSSHTLLRSPKATNPTKRQFKKKRFDLFFASFFREVPKGLLQIGRSFSNIFLNITENKILPISTAAKQV
jgi:hypothetical protein